MNAVIMRVYSKQGVFRPLVKACAWGGPQPSLLLNPAATTREPAFLILPSLLFLPAFRIPTDTLSLIGQSDGSAQQAGGLPQVAGAGVGDSIVPTEVLFRGGRLRANPITGHAVGVIGLVHHTRGAAWTEHIPTGLFTFALVLDFQFRLLFAPGLEECTFVAVGFAVHPADGTLPGDIGTIWGTHAAGFVLLVHPAFLPGATVHVLTRFFTGDAVGGAPVEDHPLEERVVVHVLLGPRGAQAARAAALLLAQLGLVQDLAAAVLGLAEPAVPSLGAAVLHELAEQQQQEAKPAGLVPGADHPGGRRGARSAAARGAGAAAGRLVRAARVSEASGGGRRDPGAAPRSQPAARAIQWTSEAGRSRALNLDGGLRGLRWAVSQCVGLWEGGLERGCARLLGGGELLKVHCESGDISHLLETLPSYLSEVPDRKSVV